MMTVAWKNIMKYVSYDIEDYMQWIGNFYVNNQDIEFNTTGPAYYKLIACINQLGLY